LVILTSKYRQRELQKGNLAIFIGRVTATTAALFNIADAVAFGDPENHADIPTRVLFFFLIWIALFIFPVFANVLAYGKSGKIQLTTLVGLAL
jgi:hypothetical protein